MNTKNYAYTDLSVDQSLFLEIGDPGQGPVPRYEVAQFHASYAINEIPQAHCLLATGRDIRSLNAATPAQVHRRNTFKQMTKARVVFHPRGEYKPDGTKWPATPQVIFDGYFMGFIPKKLDGKIQVVAPLVHFLVDMAASSCLSGTAHVANPTQISAAAVMSAPLDLGSGLGTYISADFTRQMADTTIAQDVWLAIKTIFCGIASVKTLSAGAVVNCEGTGDFRANDRALKALARIEGDAEQCKFTGSAERYAATLKIENAPAIVTESAATAIAAQTIDSFANVSFWDKLVGSFCPSFGMSVVPMADRALVIADTPAFRGAVWKEIGAEEYDGFDANLLIDRPLRGIGVVALYESDTQAGITQRGEGQPWPIFGGCYVEQSVDANDGLTKLVASPPWLRNFSVARDYVGDTTQVKVNAAGRFVGCDGPGRKAADAPGTIGQEVQTYFVRYAHAVYVNEMLRGHHGSLSGKLRFDIAPGSIIRVRQKAEKFIGAEDDLAVPIVACVSRVTIAINAEAPAATTVLQFTHARREDPENRENRTSVAEHPLFGTAIHGGGRHGSPLVPAYDL